MVIGLIFMYVNGKSTSCSRVKVDHMTSIFMYDNLSHLIQNLSTIIGSHLAFTLK